MPKARPTRRRLIVLANRLPVQADARSLAPRWLTSSGGLVTALAPVLKDRKGLWIGWTGSSSKRRRPFVHDGLTLHPLPISDRESDSFYNHLSNRTLWPLYHDAIRVPEFDHTHWRPYVGVNERFARAAASVAKPGDTVWVHDYHLQLVPGMLRALRPDLRIGFFLHIPFPPEELFAWLPWRRQILEGLLGADVVGFQTPAGAANFARAARQFAEADGPAEALQHQGRSIRVGSYPISIDVDQFEALARSAPVAARAREIRKRLGVGRKVLLAVDRLDYTKGIDTRLRAFEMLLHARRLTAAHCVLIQVAVPSREQAMEYAEQRTRIEQIVGRINGEFSEPGRVAVHYFRRSLPREELVAYYRAADVMLVTPLRDGMNLVAKEYVACRPDNSGVLVLSEFAGAAQQMRRALLVNPRDVEGLARTIHAALALPKPDASQRMAILRMTTRRHDVHHWAQEFLAALES